MKAKKTIILIHPLGENWTSGEQDLSHIVNIMPPMGLLSLAAWMEKHGHRSDIHDCYAFPGRDERIFSYIKDRKPEYIGFSTTTSSFLDAVRLAERAKEIHPGIRTVFGGVHMSGLRERLLRDYPIIDFGVVGEGEQTLLELVESDGQNPESIEGLVFRKNGEVVFTGFRKKLIDLDTLPFPAYEKLEGFPQSYKLPIFSYPKAPNTTVITSRGCPYTCSYCDRSVFRRTYRYNSPEYMLELITHLHKRFNIKHVNIYDDTFTLKRERVLKFCELKIKSGLKMTFNCAARTEQLDEEMLRMMKRAGCWMISLGIETGDPDLLKRHRSYLPTAKMDNPLENIRAMVHLIKKSGIRAKGLFMMGLPGETEASIDKSMEYVFSLPLDEFNLAKLTPFPGAPIYGDIREHGTFDEDWTQMNALNFMFIPRGFTRERLEERYREFYRRYFTRPQILLKYTAMIWKSPDSWKRFWMDLPRFLRFRKNYEKR
ncbi:MAG TPA: radical SAM protein [Nitrospirota bacterium]|nr:radical SAM protein [Nitrospirota bacterium]